MANSFDSNITSKVARVFMKAFEANRVLSKTVNTSLLAEQFTPAYGTTVYVKRPHQYSTLSTTDGDISGETKNSIVSGKAPATVQNWITVALEWQSGDEATKMDQLEKMIAPAAEQCVIDLETKLCTFMHKYSGLSYGTPGTAIDAWTDVAACGSLMKSLGVPSGGTMYYVANPFVIQNLAGAQYALSGSDSLIATAWEKSKVQNMVGGLQVLASNSLSTYTVGGTTDQAGAISGTPDVTYATAKDTMTQSLTIGGLTASVTGAVKAGDVLEVTGKYYVNPRTGQTIQSASGTAIKWRCSVTADANTNGSGVATVTVSPAGIYESGGQYNNMNAALASADVITLLGTKSAIYMPAMFYHEQAFGLATIKLPKLYATDTVATTQDGISVRVSKYSAGDYNKQQIRFDILPAFACFNPLFAGKGFGA